MSESNLLENIRKIRSSAELVYKNKDYTSATILTFKLAFSVLDLLLLRSEGRTPKDHSERFRMLERARPDLYRFLDKYFRVYQDTYSTSIDKQICDEVRRNVQAIMEREGIGA